MRPICPACNQRPRAIAYYRNNKIYYRLRCTVCIRKKKKLPAQTPRWESNGYKKKTQCDMCGFRARYAAQLRVFHVDGNLNNGAIRNLKTICLNCQIVADKDDLIWRPGDLSPDS
jgi:hypothetical protein